MKGLGVGMGGAERGGKVGRVAVDGVISEGCRGGGGGADFVDKERWGVDSLCCFAGSGLACIT